MDAPSRESQIFILSPASCSGRRAELLLSDRARFDLAQRLRAEGAPLGEVFSFLSGLYFRGKAAYARAFARPRHDPVGARVITAGRGLLPLDTWIQLPDLLAFRDVPIDVAEARYRLPLERDVAHLAEQLPAAAHVVLLGSIATDKYVRILSEPLGPRLMFPREFVGRGDMSRGGLLLRAVAAERELDYIPLAGAARRGTRPGRLPPMPR